MRIRGKISCSSPPSPFHTGLKHLTLGIHRDQPSSASWVKQAERKLMSAYLEPDTILCKLLCWPRTLRQYSQYWWPTCKRFEEGPHLTSQPAYNLRKTNTTRIDSVTKKRREPLVGKRIRFLWRLGHVVHGIFRFLVFCVVLNLTFKILPTPISVILLALS